MAQEITIESFSYSFNKDKNTYSLIKGPNNSIIKIPEEVNFHIVEKVCDEAFDSCDAISELIISKNVIDISPQSFIGLSNLNIIKVDPENKKYYSGNNCNAIIDRLTETIILGCSHTVFYDGLKIIGKNAFLGCSHLKEIHLPDTITEIQNDAFNNCSFLKNVSVGNKCKTIGCRAFAYCPNLKTIELPDTITFLGENFASSNVSFICESEKVKKLVVTRIKNAKCYIKGTSEYSERLDNPHKVKFFDRTVDITNCSNEFIRDNIIFTDFDRFYKCINYNPSLSYAFSQLHTAKSFEDLFKRLLRSKNSNVYKSTLKDNNSAHNSTDFSENLIKHKFYDVCYDDDCERDYVSSEKKPDTVDFDRMVVLCNLPEPPKLTLTKVSSIVYSHADMTIFDGYNPDNGFPVYFVYNNEVWAIGASWF